MINPFPTIHPIFLLYFLYGAAFLFIGFSIGAKNLKGSNLRIAHSMWLLAVFGFMQGVQEWVDIYPLLEGAHLTLKELFVVKAVSVALSTGSFLFLLQFGLSLILTDKRKLMKWTAGAYAAVCILWLSFLKLPGFGSNMLVLARADLVARNTLGLIGALAAAYGMTLYSREIRNAYHAVSRNFHYAGILFALFGFFETSLFTDVLNRSLDLPDKTLRTAAMVLTAYFIMKALNIFDVETRKKVGEQARQLVQSEKLASLGQLAAGIAHEINNPLANASLGIQLLKSRLDRENGPAVREQLDAVARHLDRAAVIAQELLQYARGQGTDLLRLNINEVITESLKDMEYALHTVVVDLDLPPVPDIRGDQGKLRQVFVNVLSNAVEAMPHGGRLSLSTALRDGMVEARIIDTGVGISAEDLPRVFEPFFTTKEVGAGTGLGLYLCYGIVKQHHGDMEITSSPGRGTTVTIKIPRAEEGKV